MINHAHGLLAVNYEGVMRSQCYVLGCLLISMLFVTVEAAQPVSVLLSQAVDRDCDGIVDAHGSAEVLPGSCIRYHVTVTHVGSKPLDAVEVNVRVPSDTQLVRSLRIVEGEALVSKALFINEDDRVRVQLGRVRAGNVSFQYSVRVL